MPKTPAPVAVGVPVAVPGRFADDLCSCFNNYPILVAGCCCPCITTGQLYERVLKKEGTCVSTRGSNLLPSSDILAVPPLPASTRLWPHCSQKFVTTIVFVLWAATFAYNSQCSVSVDSSVPKTGLCAFSGLVSLASLGGFLIMGFVTMTVGHPHSARPSRRIALQECTCLCRRSVPRSVRTQTSSLLAAARWTIFAAASSALASVRCRIRMHTL